MLLQEGGPLPGPKRVFFPNTQKWIVQGDTRADKTRDFIVKGCLGREQEGGGTQEDCSAMWLAVSGIMVMGLVSRWSLANILIQSLSWWRTHCSGKMDASKRDSGKWTDTVSLFNLSQTLPVGGGLLVLYSLSGSPVIKQLMQMVTMVPGQGGQFQSVCFP